MFILRSRDCARYRKGFGCSVSSQRNDVIVPSALCPRQPRRSGRVDQGQPAEAVAGKIPLSRGRQATDIRTRHRLDEGAIVREPVHPATPWRGDGDFAAVAAERDTASISLHREFVGEQRFRQVRRNAHPMQPQQRRRSAGLALPLHRESDKAVGAHRQVADGVLPEIAFQFDLFTERSGQRQICEVRPHRGDIQLAPVGRIRGDAAIGDDQRVAVGLQAQVIGGPIPRLGNSS